MIFQSSLLVDRAPGGIYGAGIMDCVSQRPQRFRGQSALGVFWHRGAMQE